MTAATVQRWTRYGIRWSLPKEESVRISELDSQKNTGKSIFGGGYLVSERMVKANERAEKEANERAAAERLKTTKWTISERERRIIADLAVRT